jgi:hypothetical protein
VICDTFLKHHRHEILSNAVRFVERMVHSIKTLHVIFALALMLLGVHAQAQVAAAVGSTRDFHAGTPTSVGTSAAAKHPTLSAQGLGGSVVSVVSVDEADAGEPIEEVVHFK